MMKPINPLVNAVQLDCPVCQKFTRAVTILDPINSLVRTKCYECFSAWAYETVPAYQVERPMVDVRDEKKKRRAKLKRMKDENISDEKRNTDG